MSHVDIEDLAVLALDDATTEVPDHLREHLVDCADCAALLASLADVRRLAGAEPLVAPPAGLRERVLAEALGDVGDSDPESSTRATRSTDDLEERREARSLRRRGIPLWAAGLAAAAALVVGVGVGNVISEEAAPTDEVEVLASAELTTVEGSDPRGGARVEESDGVVTVHVEASSLEEAEDQLREVWLLNLDGTRMVSLGFLASGDEGDFEVPARLLEEGYRILDISVEPDDGDPTHSGISVARGELV